MSASGSDDGGVKIESRGKMTQRHKLELRQLQKDHEAAERKVPSKDKAGKKALAEAQAKALKEVEARHAIEVKAMDESERQAQLAESAKATEDPIKAEARKKREAKEAKKEAERLALRAEAEAEAALMPDLRGNEDRALESLLYELGLGLVPIPADGHCLFRAVAEQLVRLKRQDEKLAAAAGGGGGGSAGEVGEVTARLAGVAVTGKAPQRGGLASGFFSHSTTEGTVTAVRGACADEISRSYDEISAFLMDEDGHIPSKEDYCNRLRNTAHWGGEPELKALSDAFRVPIVVYSVGSPARVIGEQYCPEGVSLENGAKATGAAGEDGVMLMDGVIRLTYHRHAFALGAHYNAVVPYNGHDFTLISK